MTDRLREIGHRHEPDYIDRTIETVRNHRSAENCWPQWANIFADEIEDLRSELASARFQEEQLREALERIANSRGLLRTDLKEIARSAVSAARDPEGQTR